jgi:alpha-N-acetylglucosamine transferase
MIYCTDNDERIRMRVLHFGHARKFRILAFTEYRRVLVFDGDVILLGNLDYRYLFELSDPADTTTPTVLMLMEKVVVAGS